MNLLYRNSFNFYITYIEDKTRKEKDINKGLKKFKNKNGYVIIL